FTIHHSPFTMVRPANPQPYAAAHQPLTTHHSPFTIHHGSACKPTTLCCSSPTAHHSPFTIFRPANPQPYAAAHQPLTNSSIIGACPELIFFNAVSISKY